MKNDYDMYTLDKMIAMHGKASERQQLCCQIKKEISDLLLSVKAVCPKESDDIREKLTFLYAYRDNMMDNLLSDYGYAPQIDGLWEEYKKSPSMLLSVQKP